MLSIGGFSLVTGLSVTALRHYDDVGLLTPAEVDPETGYRRYRPEQVAHGRLLATLRRVDMPIETMRAIPERGLDAALAQHLERLRAAADSLARHIQTVEYYLEKGIATKISRIAQVTIVADDLATSIAFYRDAFDG